MVTGKLTGVIKSYEWGSDTLLAEFLGRRAKSAGKQAELWYGTHPLGMAKFADKQTLQKKIEDSPEKILGPQVIDNFGTQLPFMLKVLAVGSPLSIQVHPDTEEAKQGFLLENKLGIPLEDTTRNYKDANAKPEMVVALSPFTLLAGFKPFQEIIKFFTELNLLPYFNDLINLDLAMLTKKILLLSEKDIQPILKDLENNLDNSQLINKNFANILATLIKKYPNDPGILVSLLMNYIELDIGESCAITAGIPHGYLSGLGLEVLANSDNVLRGGLTKKLINKPEFLAKLAYDKVGISEVRLVPNAKAGVYFYDPGFSEFLLKQVNLNESNNYGFTLHEHSPLMIIVTKGSIEILGEKLNQGEVYWIDYEASAKVLITADSVADFFYVIVP